MRRLFEPAAVAIFAAIAAWSSVSFDVAAARPGDDTDPSVPRPTFPPVYEGILELDGTHVHNVGQILLHISNFGLIGSLPGLNTPYSGAPSAQWPKGSLTEYLFGGGIWVGALSNGERHVTTGVGYQGNQIQFEFQPGSSELDRIYRTRELDPGGARRPAPNADDDGDGRTDEDWLDGRDNDGDGRIDEDFAAIATQMFFCEYSDTDPSIKLRFPEHHPLQVLVQQSSLAWEAPAVDDFVAFDFKIINRGDAPLEQVYLGFFSDSDIGERGRDGVAIDDFAGFWEGTLGARVGPEVKNVKVSMGYMWDDDTDEGTAEGYVGLMFLGAQDPNSDGIPRPVSLHNYRFFSGNGSFDTGGDPTNDEERYRVLDGTGPRSLPPADPATGVRPPQTARRIGDYRMVVSAGPFESVDPGDTLAFQAAIVIGRYFEGLLENAVQAQLTFDGAWLDCDEDPSTGVAGRETPLCPPQYQGFFCVDQCDSCLCNPAIAGCVERVGDECLWVNADCEEEGRSGIVTGVDGRECLVHWLIGTAPPPPSMRLISSENEVDILWNNRSETTPDLRLNVLDFESYRIWRADNWTRPLGSDVNTGPGGSLWALLAEFDLANNNIGADTGLESIRYEPAISETVVQYIREWMRAHPFLRVPEIPGFTADQLDTAIAVARGVRYYRFVDPPFRRGGLVGGPCPADGRCPEIQTEQGLVNARCNSAGRCEETTPPPHSGAHYFYSVTATDHKLDVGSNGALVPVGAGLAGDPSSNFIYSSPSTNALPPERAGSESDEIYVVPNPATPETMQAWTLSPNNDDPSGVKVEFHHLPRSTGKVSVFTLAGDLVREMSFDGSDGNGTLAWDLVSRNGQDITSGIYMYSVQADDGRFPRFIGKFVVIR